MKTPLHNIRGFSLIELMVAITIGLFILGGLVAIMVNSRKNYEVQDYSARLQENARFAMDFLSHDLRMAGYMGCSKNVVNDYATATGGAITDLAPSAANGASDSITFYYGDPRDDGIFIESIADIVGAPNVWVLNQVPDGWNTNADAVGQTVVASDCGSAAMTTVSAADLTNRTITVNNTLGRVFDPSRALTIGVRRVQVAQYDIQTGAGGVPALFRNGQELVEGIENIQFLLQTVGATNYAPGSGAVAGQLASVKVGVLARSVANTTADRQYGSGDVNTVDSGNHQLLDATLSLGTLRGQRKTFTSTVLVRNSNL